MMGHVSDRPWFCRNINLVDINNPLNLASILESARSVHVVVLVTWYDIERFASRVARTGLWDV